MTTAQNCKQSPLKAWLPVIGLTFSAFVFNTSEFVPIGLLTDIANTFQTSEAHAGLLITVYAWVVAIASLPLMVVFSNVEFRRLLLSVVVLFIASHLLSACATTYTMLMASRIGVACSHAIFWSIASPLAVHVAPEGRRATALSLIITGTSVAMIVGLPMGRVIGLHLGWRMTFFCIAMAALAVFLLLSLIFPKVPASDKMSFTQLPALLRTPALKAVYIMTIIAITGHYTGYSYIEPFLGQVAKLSDSLITLALTLFGLVGLLGSVLFSRYYDKCPGRFARFAVLGMTAFLLLLHLASFNTYTILALCVLWGLAVTFYNLVFNSAIIQIAPHATSIAMAAYSGIFNVGIGGGALVGGIVCTQLSIGWIGYVGGAIGIIASFYCVKRVMPLLRETNAA